MKQSTRKTAQNLFYGAGTILRLYPSPMPKTGVVRRYYKPKATAYEALKSDWESVGAALAHITKREYSGHGEKE